MTIQCRLPSRLCLLGLLVTAAILPLRAQSQEAQVLPATLLRRVGSAVEGYRSGRPVWVVTSLQFPHDVRGVYLSAGEADRVAKLAGPNYRPLGPYVGTPDTLPGGGSTMLYSVICIKQWDTSCLRDSTRASSPVDSVRSVIISIVTTSGAVKSDTLRPEQVEAVFFTMSAVDKLLIPYYTQLYGSRYAARLREDYLRGLVAHGQH